MSDIRTSVAVYELLLQHFNLEELRTLCFRLGIDFDSIGGVAKAGKTRELVLYLLRRDRLDEIIELIQETRPDVQFEMLGEARDAANLEMETTERDRLAADVTQLLATFLNPDGDADLQTGQQKLAQDTFGMILFLSQLDENDYMAQTLNRFAQNPQKRQVAFQSTLLELMEESPFFSRTLANLINIEEGDQARKTVFKTEISGGEVGQVINVDKLEGGLNISSG